MRIYLPEKLDLSVHISKNPVPHIPKFTEAKLALLLSQIIVVNSIKKNSIDDAGYVPLSSAILKRLVYEYRQYLDYASDTEIIIEKSQFIVGDQCRHFKFHPDYQSKIRLYVPINFHVPKYVNQNLENNIVLPKDLKFLSAPFNSGALTISYKEAKDFFDRQHNYYLKNPDKIPTTRVKNSIKWRKKNPCDIYNAALYNLDRLKQQEYHVSVDKTSGRCHTNITNMPSLMRHFLQYDGEYLVSIDVSCCQPYELNVLWNPFFYYCGKNFDKKILSLKNQSIYDKYYVFEGKEGYLRLENIDWKLYRKIVSTITGHNSIFTLVNRCQTLSQQEIQEYQMLTTTNTFYQEFQKKLVHDISDKYLDMSQVKIEVLKMLYSSNKYTDAPKRIFSNSFGTVYDFTCFYKESDKDILPILLQKIESEIILHRVAKRIHRERPDLFFFTVHDSIMTTVGNENYVSQVMKEEFAACIGPVPHTKFDYYRTDCKKILSKPY